MQTTITCMKAEPDFIIKHYSTIWSPLGYHWRPAQWHKFDFDIEAYMPIVLLQINNSWWLMLTLLDLNLLWSEFWTLLLLQCIDLGKCLYYIATHNKCSFDQFWQHQRTTVKSHSIYKNFPRWPFSLLTAHNLTYFKCL